MYKIPESAKKNPQPKVADADLAKKKEGLSAWERWELPQIGAVDGEKDIALARAMPGKKVLRPITLDELEEIRANAYHEGITQGKQDGFAKGKKEGYQAGLKQGLEAGEAEVRANIAKFSQLTRLLMQPIEEQDAELESTLVGLVAMLAKQIIKRELILDSSGVIACVKEALNHISVGAKRIKIHLNPVDHDVVANFLKTTEEFNSSWRLVPHRTLTAGGCIVESDESILDLSVERRLEDLLKQFYEKSKAAENNEYEDPLDRLLSGADDDVELPRSKLTGADDDLSA